MAGEEVRRIAARELAGIDRRAFFWVDLAIGTPKDEPEHADRVSWNEIDWDEVRSDIDKWLDGLDPDEPPTTAQWPVNENVLLVFRARGRKADARGYHGMPSLVIAEPSAPELHFADGTTGSLYSLTRDEVQSLAAGENKLALDLPSHRETWGMLFEQMLAFENANTSEIPRLWLEPIASALGLKDAPSELGDFDETWRLLHGVDFPMTDDPRDE